MGIVMTTKLACDRCRNEEQVDAVDEIAERGWTTTESGLLLCPKCVKRYDDALEKIKVVGRYLVNHASDFYPLGEIIDEDGLSFVFTITASKPFTINVNKKVLVLKN